jgi:PAS domain S-box-containing protein
VDDLPPDLFPLIFRNSPMGTVLHRADGAIIAANPAAERILGLSWDQMQGLTPMDPRWKAVHHDGRTLPPEDMPASIALRFERRVEDFIMGVYQPRFDATRWLSVSGTPLTLHGEHYAFAVFEDITEQLEAQDALRDANLENARLVEQYRRITERQKRFVSDASHELRAPLTAIQGNLELLRRYDPSPEERAEMLTEAEREARRLSRLVTDLLVLARGDADVEMHLQPLTLSAPLLEAWQEARRISGDAHRLELGQMAVVLVNGNADRLHQLGLILLENAIKYTPRGGLVRLEVEVIGDEAVIRVSDTGIGIAPEHLPLIFERFYRADPGRTRGEDPGGTGLGLSIAKWIADCHAARIAVSSQPGRGTTIEVSLPLLETNQSRVS